MDLDNNADGGAAAGREGFIVTTKCAPLLWSPAQMFFGARGIRQSAMLSLSPRPQLLPAPPNPPPAHFSTRLCAYLKCHSTGGEQSTHRNEQ